MAFSGTSSADMRMSLVGTYLLASAHFAARAKAIELMEATTVTEELQTEHRGSVLASVMQSSAALEAEVYEIAAHGPGHHLGSNGIDAAGHQLLEPLTDLIDSQEVLERYCLVLHLLQKPALDRSTHVWEHAQLLIRLRNSVVHYKSRWNNEIEATKFLKSLKKLRQAKPPFVSIHSPYYPTQCLNAACALWAVQSALRFLEVFYGNLGFPGRFSYLNLTR